MWINDKNSMNLRQDLLIDGNNVVDEVETVMIIERKSHMCLHTRKVV